MFLKLFKMLPGRVWLIGGLAVAVAGGWLWYRGEVASLETALAETHSKVVTLTTARDQWQARAEQRRQDLEDAEARVRAQEAALVELHARLVEIDERYRPLRERIEQAPEADDGEVAPVLRDTLESLP